MTEQAERNEHETEELADEHVDADEREAAEHLVRKHLAFAQIRQYGDPVLRMRAEPVEEFDDELERITTRMIALMHDADGAGLAATQIGVLRRFFVFNDDGEDRVLVNPEITKRSSETEMEEEGCLSLGPVRVPVERHLVVTIEGRDAGGDPVKLELEGVTARIVQHEVDHLDGVLIVERTDPASRREALGLLRPRLAL